MAILRKVSWAGGNSPSFDQAARMLQELADMEIEGRQVGRITERVGRELIECRQRPDFVDTTVIPKILPAAVIAVDGGRVQVRAEDSAPGVHQPHWRETKVAHLQILESAKSEVDPQPEVPSLFMNRDHVRAMVAQMSRTSRTEGTQEKSKTAIRSTEKPSKKQKSPPEKRMKCLLKSCVASVCSAEEFVPLLRNEMRRLELDRADRKLFIADGGAANWLIHDALCPNWDPLLDFVHLVSHLFTVATRILKKPDEAWKLYQHLVTLAWKNKPSELIFYLIQHQAKIGKPKKDAPENDPARLLENTIQYVRNNQSRMDYPKARRLGLPISSCNVESLIKQINQRVKASDKFWCVNNLEAVLQVRAAELSTNRWLLFWKSKSAPSTLLKKAA